jgi:high-affinity iron transporter
VFDAQCSSCHGASGRGDGPTAKGMDPAPANFHDGERMRQRSVYGLYNTITLGVGGTRMQGFRALSDDQRWALAFYVASLRQGADALQAGEAAWAQGQHKQTFAGLKELVTQSPAEVQSRHGDAAVQAQAWLVARPEALPGASSSPLQFARTQLDESMKRYALGERDAARQLAIAAYLEGFELVENSLDRVAPELRLQIEREMMALRNSIGDAKPAAEVSAQSARIQALLDQAQDKMSGDGLDASTAFFSSLLILLREGLEAILVLAAIVAFVRKTGRRDAMRWIHVGWIAAVVLGALTWFVADRLIAISGASRELTEGFTALVAAAMLLYVGYWLHSKSYAQAWQQFIRDQVNAALGKGTLWAMAAVSFLAVYRELFEIVLFYQALWVQAGDSGRHAVLAGIGAAAALLTALTWLILKFSVRLPLAPFFAATAGLLALLAVVFAGHGVAALQEAGVVNASPVHFVTIPQLGMHATLQGVLTQLAALTLVAFGVWLSRRGARTGAPEPKPR